MLATAAPPGTPEIDLLVLSTDGETTKATIQVKTRTKGPDGGWHMQAKHEHIMADRLFYTFVDFEPTVPVVYVIPSARVAEVIRSSHQAWLAIPGRGGRPHADGKMRRLLPTYGFPVAEAIPGWMDEYREAWNLIAQH
jgi:hypothetical protein